MSSRDLFEFLRKGRNSQFNLELRQLREDGAEVTFDGQTFEKVELRGFEFVNIDFTNVAFNECRFEQVRFERCNLEGTYFDNVACLESVFQENTGEGFAIDASTFTQTTFRGMGLLAPEWTDVQLLDCTFERLEFTEPLLERVTLRGGSLTGWSLSEGELTHVTLRELDDVGGMNITDCTTSYCYVVHPNAELPEGFQRKSGKRRTVVS
ncbi:MAG: pentapeptide repeat-containing protein [Myxococcota bacterium]